MREQKVLENIIKRVKDSNTAVVIAHQNPDGDTLGSMLATGAILQELGLTVNFVMHDPVPEIYKFLPFATLVKKTEDPGLLKEYDLAFSLDCGSVKRLGKAQEFWKLAKIKVNIDHHISNEMFGDINWIEGDATSTGQLVYWLGKALGVNITKEIATLLYTTLLTDTRCYSNSNTNAEALSWGAELIRLGADHEKVYRKAFLEKPLKSIKIFSIGLNNLTLCEKDKIAWTYVTLNDMKKYNATGEDTEDIADYMIRTKGIEVGIFFREDKNETKVSLRSNTDFDVSKIAVSLGGGGHKRAAGINLKIPLDKARELVLGKVIESYKVKE